MAIKITSKDYLNDIEDFINGLSNSVKDTGYFILQDELTFRIDIKQGMVYFDRRFGIPMKMMNDRIIKKRNHKITEEQWKHRF